MANPSIIQQNSEAPKAGPPNIPEALMKWLEKAYPLKNPPEGRSLELIYREAGRQDVIQNLRDHYRNQNKE